MIAVSFVRDACQLPSIAFSNSGEVVSSYGVVTAEQVHPESFKEVIQMAKGEKDFIHVYTFEMSQHKNFEREMKGYSSMVAY